MLDDLTWLLTQPPVTDELEEFIGGIPIPVHHSTKGSWHLQDDCVVLNHTGFAATTLERFGDLLGETPLQCAPCHSRSTRMVGDLTSTNTSAAVALLEFLPQYAHTLRCLTQYANGDLPDTYPDVKVQEFSSRLPFPDSLPPQARPHVRRLHEYQTDVRQQACQQVADHNPVWPMMPYAAALVEQTEDTIPHDAKTCLRALAAPYNITDQLEAEWVARTEQVAATAVAEDPLWPLLTIHDWQRIAKRTRHLVQPTLTSGGIAVLAVPRRLAVAAANDKRDVTTFELPDGWTTDATVRERLQVTCSLWDPRSNTDDTPVDMCWNLAATALATS